MKNEENMGPLRVTFWPVTPRTEQGFANFAANLSENCEMVELQHFTSRYLYIWELLITTAMSLVFLNYNSKGNVRLMLFLKRFRGDDDDYCSK